jgi:hypothetical protein
MMVELVPQSRCDVFLLGVDGYARRAQLHATSSGESVSGSRTLCAGR